MARNTALLDGLKKEMLGLEIGASISPIACKAEGWNIKVVDHATEQELRAKYQNQPGVNIGRIEAVDIVWSAQALHDNVDIAQHHSFDYCLASHLIEHIPDLLTFFHSIERLLKPYGILSLAVPDKRFCFDAFKPISTTADVLQAHMQRYRATRHSGKTRFENIAYNVTSGEDRCWGKRPLQELAIFSKLAEAQSVFDPAAEDPASPYSDCHAWYFTPSSFRLIVTELRALGRTRLSIEKLSPSNNGEFLVRMRLDSPSDTVATQVSEEQRMALMLGVLAEQAEQYYFIAEPLRQRLAALLPNDHPRPSVELPSHAQAGLLNSDGFKLLSTMWAKVDKIKSQIKNYRA